MSGDFSLPRIDESVVYLHDVTRSQIQAGQPDVDRLIDAYLEVRKTLASEFRQLANATWQNAPAELANVKAAISEEMLTRFGQVAPERLLRIRGYGWTHAVALAYLRTYVRHPVPSSRIRVLVGDQIHTERRVRDLRDLGFDISWKKVGGEDQYVLADELPDLGRAAKLQLALNLGKDRTLPADRKSVFMEMTRLGDE